MVAANLSKGGGQFLISCCSRGGGGGLRHPLLSTTCCCVSRSPSPSYYCYSLPLLPVEKKGKGNRNCEGTGPFSLSLSAISSINDKRTTAARRVFCTTSSSSVNVAADSLVVPTTFSSSSCSSTPNVDDDNEDDMNQIKNAAKTLDIRVGLILKAWRHEEADSLYVEEVDIGEPQPRIICSGLVNSVPLDHLQDKKVVVLANLKPRNMRGVKSYGMLMAASDASHENVELLEPAEGSLPGERVWFGSEDEKEDQLDAASPNQIQKKKIWELVQPHLRTDASCVAALGMHIMRTTAGMVVCRSLKNANIS